MQGACGCSVWLLCASMAALNWRLYVPNVTSSRNVNCILMWATLLQALATAAASRSVQTADRAAHKISLAAAAAVGCVRDSAPLHTGIRTLHLTSQACGTIDQQR